jgi:hypothetical protein
MRIVSVKLDVVTEVTTDILQNLDSHSLPLNVVLIFFSPETVHPGITITKYEV